MTLDVCKCETFEQEYDGRDSVPPLHTRERDTHWDTRDEPCVFVREEGGGGGRE